MSKYKHIFFDLDNTIWDFDKNSLETLTNLYVSHKLESLGVKSFDTFHKAYVERNAMMWDQYRLGKIDKPTLRDKRFELTFWDMGLDPDLVPKELAIDYLKQSPLRNHLFPHAHKVLSYLKEKYILHIITNGFEEAQTIKMEASDLNKYFDEVIISEHTGFRKPDIRIFEYSIQKTGADPQESLMIGDGLEVDVLGAISAGWHAVYFNPLAIPHTESPTFEIRSLDELTTIL